MAHAANAFSIVRAETEQRLGLVQEEARLGFLCLAVVFIALPPAGQAGRWTYNL